MDINIVMCNMDNERQWREYENHFLLLFEVAIDQTQRWRRRWAHRSSITQLKSQVSIVMDNNENKTTTKKCIDRGMKNMVFLYVRDDDEKKIEGER